MHIWRIGGHNGSKFGRSHPSYQRHTRLGVAESAPDVFIHRGGGDVSRPLVPRLTPYPFSLQAQLDLLLYLLSFVDPKSLLTLGNTCRCVVFSGCAPPLPPCPPPDSVSNVCDSTYSVCVQYVVRYEQNVYVAEAQRRRRDKLNTTFLGYKWDPGCPISQCIMAYLNKDGYDPDRAVSWKEIADLTSTLIEVAKNDAGIGALFPVPLQLRELASNDLTELKSYIEAKVRQCQAVTHGEIEAEQYHRETKQRQLRNHRKTEHGAAMHLAREAKRRVEYPENQKMNQRRSQLRGMVQCAEDTAAMERSIYDQLVDGASDLRRRIHDNQSFAAIIGGRTSLIVMDTGVTGKETKKDTDPNVFHDFTLCYVHKLDESAFKTSLWMSGEKRPISTHAMLHQGTQWIHVIVIDHYDNGTVRVLPTNATSRPSVFDENDTIRVVSEELEEAWDQRVHVGPEYWSTHTQRFLTAGQLKDEVERRFELRSRPNILVEHSGISEGHNLDWNRMSRSSEHVCPR